MNQPVDLSNLRDITGGDDELEKELFSEFMHTVGDCIHTLESAYTDEKQELWRENSHSLKGISLNLGAKKLAELAHRAQELFKESVPIKQAALAEIQAEYAKVKQFLEDSVK